MGLLLIESSMLEISPTSIGADHSIVDMQHFGKREALRCTIVLWLAMEQAQEKEQTKAVMLITSGNDTGAALGSG
jgi:hypothetical protein